MGRERGLRNGVLAGASALAVAIATGAAAMPGMVSFATPAAAQGDEAELVYRQEALAHARAIAEAWRRLEDHIQRRSAAPTVWTGPVPPASTGWLDAWTERGVRARYCDDTLLVYMEPASLKGVGRDHRSVQVAAAPLRRGWSGGPALARRKRCFHYGRGHGGPGYGEPARLSVRTFPSAVPCPPAARRWPGS